MSHEHLSTSNVMKDSELIKWAEERHRYYCFKAEKFMKKLRKEFLFPFFRIYAKDAKVAGWAKWGKKTCEYNLVYLLYAKEDYDQTIAHEVSHFVVNYLFPEASNHGDLFKFVFKEIYGKIVPTKHNYRRTRKNIQKAKAMIKLRVLKHTIWREGVNLKNLEEKINFIL